MKLFTTLFAAAAAVTAMATNTTHPAVAPNGCVTFSVSAGTGCAWMCNYCSGALSTNNYYFTTDVCTYQQGAGCVGNPIAGVPYTCCAASGEAEEAEEEVLEAEDVFAGDGDDCGSEEDADYDSYEGEEEEDEDVDAYHTQIWILQLRQRNA